MCSDTKEIRVRALINSGQIKWSLIENILQNHFKIAADEVHVLVDNFRLSLEKPFLVGWFLNPRLKADEQKVVAAMCEAHGADQVTIHTERDVQAGLSGRYEHQIDFTLARSKQSGEKALEIRPRVSMEVLGIKFKLSSLFHLLIAQTLLFFLGVTSFVVLGISLLYAISVFLLFLLDPATMTFAATRSFSLGLALLCMLLLCAKALYNVGNYWRKRER